jgi:ceramide glucosyltransferase
MAFVVAAVLVAAGLAALAAMAWAQRRQLRVAAPPLGDDPPAVSVLKPLKGLDPGLADNLESFFRLDYPRYEVILGVAGGDDPAVAVARRVAAAHPHVPSRVVVDPRRVGFNPKVNNLANLAAHARHDVLLVSDSNVRVAPGYLADLVAHLLRPGVGLVSSPIRGPRGASLGAALEGLQLNTFVMGGVAAMANLVGGVCVVGKSMLLRRETLSAIGGFEHLAGFLAEDQVCGQEVARLGWRTVVSGRPIDNVLGPLSVREFLARHLRWARIRRRVAPAGFAAELLLSPTFIAALALLADPSPATLALLAAVAATRAALDAAAEGAAGTRRPLAAYLLLSPLKDVLVGGAWVVPFLDATVTWRGHRFRVGRRTRLEPLAPSVSRPSAGLAPDGEPVADLA